MKFSILTIVWVVATMGAAVVDAFAPLIVTPPRRPCSVAALRTAADIEQETQEPLTPAVDPDIRGKVNEIDFCIAPADVSLSRSYGTTASTSSSKSLSLTRALNNASNRAVRRILLARSWPSPEALNLSLRQVVLAAEKERGVVADIDMSTSKCPVPRPILNILVRRNKENAISKEGGDAPTARGRTDEEYVADQLKAFRERYSAVPGFALAEAYLECILSLATSGEESPRVTEVMEAGVYDESYRRVVAVLRSVGAVFEKLPGTDRLRIAQRLVDQDICLSMMDKIAMKQDRAKKDVHAVEVEGDIETPDKESVEVETKKETLEQESTETAEKEEMDKNDPKFRLQFWKKTEKKEQDKAQSESSQEEGDEEEFTLSRKDLGGVLLSAEEPSMTRQLNALSNIAQRALLFGGDQELLVLSETLEADKPAFVQRWYPGPDGEVEIMSPQEETRPGVQYLNCIVLLLKECYNEGIVTNLDPPLPLIPSYSNAYERLTASLVELGSGYIKPTGDVMMMPAPRNAQEELGRFAVWESTFRSKNIPDVSAYPEDLEGTWEVKDEVGGETIGVSTVVFQPQGQVVVEPPMKGRRWRLDPGPAHLDTCTFQVLGEDGTILQYRGFIDRGARLEARFSKRRIRIRGSVMFQMRDGEFANLGDEYWKDMLPINYRTGTTKFVMTKEK